MLNRNKKGLSATKHGFTLLELLIVIAVIGILSSFILSSFNVAKHQARDTKRLAGIRELKTALEIYFDSAQNYPAALSNLVPSYIQDIPVDPLDNNVYAYFKCNNKQYHLGASLEDSNNDALTQDLDAVPVSCSGSTIDSPDDDGCANEENRYCYDLSN